jgi:DNA invertase Pin-like site-specific DNA recombinase
MLIGYCRVSKQDGTQVLDLQLDALVAAGVQPHAIYRDLMSGRTDQRPELDHCLKALRRGDTLVIWTLDRLGRSLRHLMNLLHHLDQEGIALKILSGTGAGLNTNTPTGKMLFQMLGMLAEFEANLIRERTVAGLAAAKARGRKGGRPYALRGAAKDLAVVPTDMSVQEIAQTLQVSKSTIYRARQRQKAQDSPTVQEPLVEHVHLNGVVVE